MIRHATIPVLCLQGRVLRVLLILLKLLQLVLLQFAALVCAHLVILELRIAYVGEIWILADLLLQLLNLDLLNILLDLFGQEFFQLIADVML